MVVVSASRRRASITGTVFKAPQAAASMNYRIFSRTAERARSRSIVECVGRS